MNTLNDKELAVIKQAIMSVIDQGKQSVDPDTGQCKYRLDTTASCPIRCGIGHLIKDEHYNMGMEGKAVTVYEVKNPLIKSLGFYPSTPLLNALSSVQGAHDVAFINSFIKTFKENLLFRMRGNKLPKEIKEYVSM